MSQQQDIAVNNNNVNHNNQELDGGVEPCLDMHLDVDVDDTDVESVSAAFLPIYW